MSIIVNTNVQSLIAQRNLSAATNGLSSATDKLSTGLRINKASDDPAGLFVAKGLEANLSGSQQCQTNISLGINVLQIAEGDLSTIQDNVTRIKDLATQAASGVYSSSSRAAIKAEITARLNEIDRIAKASNFNGFKLLDGTETALDGGLRIQVGAGSESQANSITITGVFEPSLAINFGLTESSLDISSATAAAAAIGKCETALNDITSRRANLGVSQVRLEMSAEGLATTIENVSSAKSTIMDTDVASTTSDYTKQQILQQISVSVLTQANQAPTVALSLMQG